MASRRCSACWDTKGLPERQLRALRAGRLCLCLLLLLQVAPSASLAPRAPTGEPDLRVEQLFDALSVEERVGQLFLVDFVGRDSSDASAIAQLITDYHVGGVILQASNNNIANGEPDAVRQLAQLTNGLQRVAYRTASASGGQGSFVPLFVAVDHEGDDAPRTHLRDGFTSIPSAMAIGATWSLEDAEAVGEVIGRELAVVGVNMLLGPVVDVLANPHPEGAGDINIRAFGGDPHWVGQMGRAYIRGVHVGSQGRVLTVAKHFPGHGGSDRLPDDEVATVNRSLEELRQADLIPFFEVTRHDPTDPLGTTDAMMPSHIRYRGFQGDVSQLTRPISLDPAGMAAFMALEPLARWRETGLVVCDSLGVEAVKGYYDPSMATFPYKQIAQDALMTGNDLLPVINYGLERDWFGVQLPNVQATIAYFQEQYRSNSAFRARVDEAVHHILSAKLAVYPDLSLESVLVDETDETDETAALDTVGRGAETVRRVGEHALTLLYPSAGDLRARLPQPPRSGQDILIAGCFEQCLPPPATRLYAEQVRTSLLQLYGPQGSGLIEPEQVTTLDFDRLYRLLHNRIDADPAAAEDGRSLTLAQAEAIREQIRAADWIVLLLVNYMPDTNPQTGAARDFLRSTQFDLRDKEIVAISLHAPYYLDATEIGKLSAYWAVYSKIDPCVQVAWRALFQEMDAPGAPPVSVEGINYDLQTRLSPDPAQVVRLTLLSPTGAQVTVGSNVAVETSPLRNRIGRTVRDGTAVHFDAYYPDLDVHLDPRVMTGTVDGVAGAIFSPALEGDLEIVARVDGAASAQPIRLAVVLPASPTPATATHSAPTPVEETPVTSAPPGVPAGTAGPAGTEADRLFPGWVDAGPAGWIVFALALGLTGAAGAGLWWYRRSRRRRGPLVAVDSPAVPPLAATSVDTTGSIEVVVSSLVGRTLGSCRITHKIGQGGMGQVYRGYQPLLDRTVAVKVLPSALVASEEMRHRFQQEARIAASLRHPNIIQIHDFGIQGDLIYMIMEYVDGQSLKERLAELNAAATCVPMREALAIARQIADALAYAHTRGAIHRDVKPANILLSRDGSPVLADFGLVVLRGGPRYTIPGTLWGSPAYMAPELFDGQHDADERSDVYALGIVLYEMLAGRPPFEASSPTRLAWQHANVEPPALRERVADLPEALEATVLRALHKDPRQRYASAADLAAALDELT